MKNEYQIDCLSENERTSAKIILNVEGNEVKLVCYLKDLVLETKDNYPFFALVKLRLQLESKHIKFICNGNRIDVYPSGSSAIGFMAYELIDKQPATKLVNIFEPTSEINKICTVEDQKQYWENWIKSLTK